MTTTQPTAPDPLADAWQAAQYVATCLTQMRQKRGDTLPTAPDAGIDHNALVIAATEALRLIELGPRAVRCDTCGAPAGISCTLGLSLEPGQCHHERRFNVQAVARATLRRALGLPPHNPLAPAQPSTPAAAGVPLPAAMKPAATDA